MVKEEVQRLFVTGLSREFREEPAEYVLVIPETLRSSIGLHEEPKTGDGL